MELISVKDRLPNVEAGSFLVFSPTQFPKNSRFIVAEYYDDVKMFYNEADENPITDVTHWCELPKEPKEQLIIRNVVELKGKVCAHNRIEEIQGGQIERCRDCGKQWG